MATLQSVGNGNFTNAGTWYTVNATSFLNNVTATTNVTTTPQNSTSFTPGAITVAGVTIQIAGMVASPTGTFTVEIWNASALSVVSGTTVTINCTDLPSTLGNVGLRGIGWAYFQFSSPVTLLAATLYAVRLTSSVSNQVQVFASATTNWSRGFVTTTTAAPAATDILLITGAYPGAGTSVTSTVTMDNTNSTAFGDIYVATGGTLAYGTSAATAYNLRLAGNFYVTMGGTLTMGTLGTPVPSNSTAIMEFNVASSGQFGLLIGGGTTETYGMVKTPFVRLGADAAVAATTVTLNSTPTGWSSGDTIGFPSTTTTATQAEVRVLSATVSTASATVTSGLTNAHGGNSTTLVQGHVCNLTRNVRIQSVSATLTSFTRINGSNTSVSFNYTLFLMMGATTAALAAFSLFNANTSSSCVVVISNCVIYQSTALASAQGFVQGTTGLSTTFPSSYTFNDNVMWNVQGNSLTLAPPTAGALTTRILTNNLIVRSGPANVTDWFTQMTGTIFASAATSGLNLSIPAAAFPTGTVSNWDGMEFYSNATNGFVISGANVATTTSPVIAIFNNWTGWRNGSNLRVSDLFLPFARSILRFVNFRTFGNTTGQGQVSLYAIQNSTVEFLNSYFWGGTTQVATIGFFGAGSGTPTIMDSVFFTDCTFGRDHLGNLSNFTTSIFAMNTYRGANNIIVKNPTMSGTIVSRLTTSRDWGNGTGIVVYNLNNVSNDNYIYSNTNTISVDTSIFKTSSPSTRITPVAIGGISPSSTVRVPIKSGQTCTITVWVRKSTAYNGSQPFLMWRYNPISGNSDNTTVDTMTVDVDTWEQLSYTTPTIISDCVLEFVVVCDGSTGWINIDEWDSSISNDTRDDVILSPWVGQYVEPSFTTGSGGGGSFVFIS